MSTVAVAQSSCGGVVIVDVPGILLALWSLRQLGATAVAMLPCLYGLTLQLRAWYCLRSVLVDGGLVD